MKTTLKAALALLVASATVSTQGLQYPTTRIVDHVDTYHGVRIAEQRHQADRSHG